ncbi:MAG: glycosyltransferase family 2 protein [Pyrinomonadaceae bacterium]
MKPLVSVIIPNYNYANYVCEAINSALDQTYENLEIIVVDDGSADNSAEIFKGYGDKITTIFQQNAGVSAARNNGVKHSSGEYVAFLDADDFWLPQKIEKQVNLFESEKDLGLVHVGVEEIDANGNMLRTRLDGMSGAVSREFLLFERSVVLGGGSGFALPRRIFDEVGGFDLDLQTSADWDLFFRVSRAYNIGFVPDVLLKYRIHGSNMHGNIKRMEREMLYGFEKAFADKSADIQRIKRKAYGNLHKTLAGSYFRTREYRDFVRHTFKSLYLNPGNIGYFAGFPARLLQRKSTQ